MSELEKDLTIDPNQLDVEWVNLPSLYFAYREEADSLDIRARKKKMRLDYEMANLDSKIRLDPLQYLGVEKPTESQIRCYIEADDNIYAIKEEMLEIEKNKKLLASACTALEMKRDALKNLVQLVNGEYFTTRRSDGAVEVALMEDKKETKRNIRREIRNRMNQQNGGKK